MQTKSFIKQTYILACKPESTCIKEQHLSKSKTKKEQKEKKKSQNLPEISLFLQLLLKVLKRFFLSKYSRKQFKNTLPLQ